MREPGLFWCVSLWQPWAQLVVLGLKRLETRSWSTKHRGPLLIHAARRRPEAVDETRPHLARFYRLLAERGFPRAALPRGAIVGAARIVNVHRTEDLEPLVDRLGLDELAAGDFSPGRYAWELEDRTAIKPVPWRGFQGLFRVPASALGGQLRGLAG